MFENINENHIVYSTDSNFKNNLTSEPKTPLLIKQNLRIHLIRLKGDKLVTVVRGFKGQNKNLKKLGSYLRKKCSVGGSTKKGEIILQGNSRKKVLQLLIDKGHQVKLSGG